MNALSRVGLGALLVLVVVLVSRPARADAVQPDAPRVAPQPAPRLVLYGAAGVGSVLDKGGGAAPAGDSSLMLVLPIVRVVALELMGSTGYAVGHGTEDDFWARLAIGLRIEDTLRDLRPYGAFRLVHLHYAAAETWAQHPLDSIAGSSSEGLQHRSGMGLAGGLSWAIPRTQGRVRVVTEAELSWVPIGTGPAWFLTTSAGIGYGF